MILKDLVIIGAGPAGMSAAIQAADLGLNVAILDEQPQLGGQIYRNIEQAPKPVRSILGADYDAGKPLADALRSCNVDIISGATLWSIETGFKLAFSIAGRAQQIAAKSVIIATGALERPMPVPGWTLPGVMTVGAGQIFLKQSGVLPNHAVLVGCGPLLYLTAAQMVRAGAPPVALVETQTRGDVLRGLAAHGMGALRGWRYLVKGLGLLAEIKRAGVKRFTAARDIAVLGEDRATGVRFFSGGQMREIACDTVFLHHGVVPNTQIARAMDVAHHWDDTQACFVPDIDDWGQAATQHLFIAGDGGAIAGAKSAEFTGKLAALQAAHNLGVLPSTKRDQLAAPVRRALVAERAARPFLDCAYPPYAGAISPPDDTIICRCEEVRAGDIRQYAKMGCLGPNQAKAFGRAGMGPCQGRYCGLSVTAILAASNGATPDQTGYFRIRSPLKPVTLGEIAQIETDEKPAQKHAH